jgi:hypothetical protein
MPRLKANPFVDPTKITIRMEANERTRLEAKAEAEDTTLSELGREAILRLLGVEGLPTFARQRVKIGHDRVINLGLVVEAHLNGEELIMVMAAPNWMNPELTEEQPGPYTIVLYREQAFAVWALLTDGAVAIP